MEKTAEDFAVLAQEFLEAGQGHRQAAAQVKEAKARMDVIAEDLRERRKGFNRSARWREASARFDGASAVFTPIAAAWMKQQGHDPDPAQVSRLVHQIIRHVHESHP